MDEFGSLSSLTPKVVEVELRAHRADLTLSGIPSPSTSPSDRVQTYRQWEIIYQPGDPADRVYVVRKGSVRLMKSVGREEEPGAQRSVLALLRPGDLFGELDQPGRIRDEWAVAGALTEVWSTKASLSDLIQGQPTLAIELVTALNQRFRQARRRLLGLTAKEVPARLADLLILLGETHGRRCPHGGEIDLQGITQQDLADLVGASRSFVSTLINRFKREGALSSVGRTLCLRDRRALGQIAQAP